MPENSPELDWLAQLTGSAAQSAKVQSMAEQRRAAQDSLNLRLPDSERAEIREALLGLSVKVEAGIGTRQLALLSADGNAMQEVDTVHHGPKTIEGLSVDDVALLNRQMEKVFSIQSEMLKNPAYAVPTPDFPPLDSDTSVDDRAALEAAHQRDVLEAEARMAEDLWLPLSRQGIIPENLIPQKYSAVAAQFKAASALYEDRLQAYSKDLTAKDILQEKFEFGMSLGKASLKLISAGTDLTGSIADVAGNDGAKLGAEEAQQIFGHFSTALSVVDKAGTAALTDKDFSAVGDVVAGTVADIISAEVGAEIGGMVGAAISSAARGVRTGQMLQAGDYKAAVVALADGIALGCAGFDKTEGKIVTAIGKSIQAGTASFVAGWKIAETGDTAKDILKTLVAEFQKIASTAADAEIGKLAVEFQGDKGGTRDATKFDLAALMQMRAAAAKKQAEDMAALQNGDEAFHLALITGFALPVDDDDAVNVEESHRLASIDYILAVQAKNQATFDLCKAIAEHGTALVVKLCPGASLVESCLTLTFTIQDAIAKAQELIIWQDNFRDAQRASSAQIDAFLNRRGLQGRQTLRAGIQTALDAAKVVAEVLKMTPAAPAAPVVTASIATVEGLMEVADIVATKAEMAAAWKVYVRARENPADRYLARKATQQNPTLAKYAMAWGATQGDPIAMEGMRRCGLNEHTLALPGSNVAKVVAYLEAKYADDPILLRAVPVRQKWHPGAVELSLRSWASFYQMATVKAVPLVSKTNDISGINAGFGALDSAEQAFAKAIDDLTEANAKRSAKQVFDAPGDVDAGPLRSAIFALRDALRRFKSLDVDGNPHPEMAAYIDALFAKTEARSSAVDAILYARPWAEGRAG